MSKDNMDTDEKVQRALVAMREHVSRAREAYRSNNFGSVASYITQLERDGMNLEDALLAPKEIREQRYQTLTAHEERCKHCGGRIQSEWTPPTCPMWGSNPNPDRAHEPETAQDVEKRLQREASYYGRFD